MTKEETLVELRQTYNSKSEKGLSALDKFPDVTSEDLFSVYQAGADRICKIRK